MGLGKVLKPFEAIGHFFKKVVEYVISPAGRAQIARDLQAAEDLINPALSAVQLIAGLAPANSAGVRDVNRLVAIVDHYELGPITPDNLTNNAVVAGVLKAAAVKELGRITGTVVDPKVLDLAIQSAYLVYKKAQDEIAAAEAPKVVAPVTQAAAIADALTGGEAHDADPVVQSINQQAAAGLGPAPVLVPGTEGPVSTQDN